jgi:hypothetical protein
MPGVQRNWNYYTYVSSDGTTYNIRAAVEWAAIAAHGLAARTPGAPRFMATRQKAPRKFTYRDVTTGRSRQGPVGTSAAFDAAALDDTEDFNIPGLATVVEHILVKKIGEKVPVTLVGTQLADHA